MNVRATNRVDLLAIFVIFCKIGKFPLQPGSFFSLLGFVEIQDSHFA